MHMHNGVLLSQKKEQNLAIHDSMGRPRGHSAK